MNRRTRTLIVLAVAISLASVAAFGVYRAIRNIPVRYVAIATKYAVVARQTVPVGAMLTKEQVMLVAWPADAPVPGGFEKVDDVVGRGVISPLVQNEPVSEAKLAPLNAGGGLPPTIPQGMRAMAVRVNDVIGVAGFTVPGTRVDVIVTVRSQKESVSRVVLNNVQVLTAGTRMDQEKSKDGQAIPNTTVVTLLLTPHDAERLALAQTDGTIVLALRNPLDTDPTDTTGARMSALLNSSSGAAEPKPVERPVVASSGGTPRPKAAAPAPPPPPLPPYTVETIRGAQRTDVVIK
jgi:pilus assembly protein CpaB